MTLDDVSFTTEIAIQSGGEAIAPQRCATLFDTGSPQTFVRLHGLDRMRLVGAALRRRAGAPAALAPGVVMANPPFKDPDPHPPERPIIARE